MTPPPHKRMLSLLERLDGYVAQQWDHYAQREALIQEAAAAVSRLNEFERAHSFYETELDFHAVEDTPEQRKEWMRCGMWEGLWPWLERDEGLSIEGEGDDSKIIIKPEQGEEIVFVLMMAEPDKCARQHEPSWDAWVWSIIPFPADFLPVISDDEDFFTGSWEETDPILKAFWKWLKGIKAQGKWAPTSQWKDTCPKCGRPDFSGDGSIGGDGAVCGGCIAERQGVRKP